MKINQSKVFWTCLVLWIVVTLFLLIASYLYWPWSERVFISDSSPQSWLSTCLLFGCALLSVTNAIRSSKFLPWIFLTIGFFTMSLDEQFMGHERVKEYIKYVFLDRDSHSLWFWGNLPMCIYPVGALIIYFLLIRSFKNKVALHSFNLGFFLGTIRVLLLFLGTPVAHFIEQVLEIICELLFVQGLLYEGSKI